MTKVKAVFLLLIVLSGCVSHTVNVDASNAQVVVSACIEIPLELKE